MDVAVRDAGDVLLGGGGCLPGLSRHVRDTGQEVQVEALRPGDCNCVGGNTHRYRAIRQISGELQAI